MRREEALETVREEIVTKILKEVWVEVVADVKVLEEVHEELVAEKC